MLTPTQCMCPTKEDSMLSCSQHECWLHTNHGRKQAKLCRKLIKENCEDVLDEMNCEFAMTYCIEELMALTEVYGEPSSLYPFDIARS